MESRAGGSQEKLSREKAGFEVGLWARLRLHSHPHLHPKARPWNRVVGYGAGRTAWKMRGRADPRGQAAPGRVHFREASVRV